VISSTRATKSKEGKTSKGRQSRQPEKNPNKFEEKSFDMQMITIIIASADRKTSWVT
jgi:hypothetical protein